MFPSESLSSIPPLSVLIAYSIPGIVFGAGDSHREQDRISVPGQVAELLYRGTSDNKEGQSIQPGDSEKAKLSEINHRSQLKMDRVF